MQWVVVGGLGILVALGEVVAVYRRAPLTTLLSPPSLLYMALNASAALAALALLYIFGWWKSPSSLTPLAQAWVPVIVAGLAAMAVLRSSITIRAGSSMGPNVPPVSVGASDVMQRILSAVDRDIDRTQAEQTAVAIDKIMAGVSFSKAKVSLPAYCLGLMRHVSDQEQDDLAHHVRSLEKSGLDDDVKAALLGTALIGVVGRGVLDIAVKHLGDSIRTAPQPTAKPRFRVPGAP